jgi:hypothetical protein
VLFLLDAASPQLWESVLLLKKVQMQKGFLEEVQLHSWIWHMFKPSGTCERVMLILSGLLRAIH